MSTNEIQRRIKKWTNLANQLSECRRDITRELHRQGGWCRIPESLKWNPFAGRAAWIRDVCTSHDISPQGHHLFVYLKIPSKHGNNAWIEGVEGRNGYEFDCLQLVEFDIEPALKMDPKTGEAIGHARLIKVDGITIDIDEFCK